LRRGRDLAFVHDLASTYIEVLTPLLRSGSEAQKKAVAGLLAQSLTLKSALARHLESLEAAIALLEHAIEYSVFAEDMLLEASACRMLAYTHYRAKHYQEALRFASRAERLMKQGNLDRLTQSWIYSVLSYCQAYNGQAQNSVESLGRARDLFDPHAPAPVHMLYSLGILYDSGGITSLRNEDYQEAATFFEKELTSSAISELVGVQAKMNRAKVEVSRDDKARDMGIALKLWTEGMEGARDLGSKMWIGEARNLYDLFRIAWPAENAIKRLKKEYL
jgi:tetratricopeptide (TPR) repeat protein